MAKKILLICGHGNGDSGATGNGHKEFELNRRVGNALKPRLEAWGFKVDMYDQSRNAFKDVQNGKFKIARDYAYVFEIHFNAYNKKAHGTEVFVTYREKNTTVEEKIMQNLKHIFTLRHGNGVLRKNFLVINTVKSMGMSSALIETCFIDNANDMKIFFANEEAIYDGIADGIGVGFGMKKAVDKEAQAKKEAEEKARKEAEAKAKAEAEKKAKEEAEKKAKELQAKKEAVAYQVYLGRYGNGAVRIAKLTLEGWNAKEINALVTKIVESKKVEAPKVVEKTQQQKNDVAYNVYLGRYGNGQARKNKLASEGYNFNEIQALVTKIKNNKGKRLS